MQEALVFSVVFAAMLFIITHSRFLAAPGLNKKMISVFFLLKFLGGATVAWIYAHYSKHGGDYWALHKDGLVEYQLLKNDPQLFFSQIFESSYAKRYQGFFDTSGSYWNDLKNTLLTKFLGIINFISRGNYYTNNLFVAAIGLFGHVGIYRAFKEIYPNNRMALLTGCFLLPGTLLFSSAIHKDFVVFTAMCLLCYCCYQLSVQKLTFRRLWLLVFCIVCLALFRSYVLLAMLPGSIAWLISRRTGVAPARVFAWSALVLAAGLLLLMTIHPDNSLMNYIIQRQNDFISLGKAHTQLSPIHLQGDLSDLLMQMPATFDHAFVRPYIWETHNFFHFSAAIETLAYWLLFIFALSRGATMYSSALLYFLLFFCLFCLILIGMIVPNYGAIIRYRSLFLPFLITPLLTSWRRIKE